MERTWHTGIASWGPLNYAGAQYYHSQTGRFTSPDDPVYIDPLDPQTWNLYGYVMNNPLRWVDPTGHQACETTYCVDVQGGLSAAMQQAIDRAHGFTVWFGGAISDLADVMTGTAVLGDPDRIPGADEQIPSALREATLNPYLVAGVGLVGGTKRLGPGLTIPRGNRKFGLEHILRRHASNSGVQGIGKFARGMGHIQIKALVREAGQMGGGWRIEGNSRVLDVNMGRIIGTDPMGAATSGLRVVTDGFANVITLPDPLAMIGLEFDVDEHELRDDTQQDPLSAAAGVLEQTYFLMPVRFSVYSTELLAAPSLVSPWLRLPLLGFATHLHSVLTTIVDGAEAAISIGGGGSLQLRRRGDMLEIESPLARATVRVLLADMLKAATAFRARVRDLIDERVQDLRKHSEWSRWFGPERAQP